MSRPRIILSRLRRARTRLAAFGAVAALSLGGFMAAAPSAHAAGPSYLTFVDDKGQITTNPTEAASFIVAGGQLVSGGGVIGASQAQLAAGYAPFQLFSPGQAAIENGFNDGPNDVLSWDNPSFSGGHASFCENIATGQVMIVFQASDVPAGCAPITLDFDLPGLLPGWDLLPSDLTLAGS
jgi:hypothetical protein